MRGKGYVSADELTVFSLYNHELMEQRLNECAHRKTVCGISSSVVFFSFMWNVGCVYELINYERMKGRYDVMILATS